MRSHLALVYLNAGGGHRAAAMALQQVIEAQRRPWQVRLVNLTDVLDPQGRFRRVAGFDPEDVYNRRLARGWTLGLGKELKLLQAMIRIGHAHIVRALRQHWAVSEPDCVVSLIPNFNRALHQSIASSLPGVPFVTVLTDIADLPPNFWVESGQQQDIIVGSERALEQARAAGHADARLHLVSGMVLRPSFYEPQSADRRASLSAMRLDPDRPTGLVMFGGQGSMQMLRIARLLGDWQLILMCGRNAALAGRLQTQVAAMGAPHAVVGFAEDVPRWMSLADYFIGKPGPGSLSEAVQMGLPVLTFRNAWTMPQERYNCEWVRENGLGLVLRSIRGLPHAVRTLLADLPEWRRRTRAIDNRAVFEIPDILQSILIHSALPRRTSEALVASRSDAASPAAEDTSAPVASTS